MDGIFLFGERKREKISCQSCKIMQILSKYSVNPVEILRKKINRLIDLHEYTIIALWILFRGVWKVRCERQHDIIRL